MPTNWRTLPVSRYVGIPYGMIQWSRNIAVTCGGIVVVVGIARVKFVSRSMITTTYWKLSTYMGRGPIMSIYTNSSGTVAGKSFRCRWFLCCVPLIRAHDSKLRTVV